MSSTSILRSSRSICLSSLLDPFLLWILFSSFFLPIRVCPTHAGTFSNRGSVLRHGRELSIQLSISSIFLFSVLSTILFLFFYSHGACVFRPGRRPHASVSPADVSRAKSSCQSFPSQTRPSQPQFSFHFFYSTTYNRVKGRRCSFGSILR